MKISVITSLYNCEKYLEGYFLAVDKIMNKDECEFLLLHNEPTQSEIEIINVNINEKPWFRHIIIDKRETLYATWNRGIKMSNGKYCAVWNVDDVRFPNSLSLQSIALDKDKNCALVFGDINGTDVYGKIGNRYYKPEIIDKYPEEAYRSCLVGCFPMWRKSIHETIGYFDEQFRCVSDFDFQIRAALHYRLCYVNESLGIYFENNSSKISSDKIQVYENNLIYMRYGVYEKLILHKIPSSLKKFRLKTIVNFNSEKSLDAKIQFNSMYRLKGIIIALLNWPIYIIRDLYHLIK